MNRQKQILFVLLIVLALSSLYAYWTTPQQSQVALSGVVLSAAGSGRPADSDTKSPVEKQKVDLGLLKLEKIKYRGYKRDVFNFYQPKPVAKPVAKPVVKSVAKPVVKATPKPMVAPQVRKQLAKFTFLGFLLKNEVRTVFLAKREELFLVRKADFFGEDDQFEVVNITEEKLTIKQRSAGGLIEIPLVEKEPLIPSFSSADSGTSKVASPATKRSSAATLPRNQVPPQEQRRKWFKNQPAPVNE